LLGAHPHKQLLNVLQAVFCLGRTLAIRQQGSNVQHLIDATRLGLGDESI
jgi:hypothetical protein